MDLFAGVRMGVCGPDDLCCILLRLGVWATFSFSLWNENSSLSSSSDVDLVVFVVDVDIDEFELLRPSS